MKFSRLPLLSAAALCFFAMSTSAADAGPPPNLSGAISSQEAAKSAAAAATAGNTGNTGNTGDAGNTGKAGKTDTKNNAKPTPASGKNTDSNSAQTTDAKSTGPSPSGVITGSGSQAPTTGSIPVITGGSSATNGGALPTGLPTLAGAFKVIPPTVPPTVDAPFMRVSTLPEGTVFIVVGAILGFLAMSVLLWRGLVAWSLHRSVKRAAMQQNMSDTKALFRTPAAPFYQYKDRESTISLGGLGHKSRKSGRPSTAQGSASQSALFFSPTAGAAGAGMNSTGNRGSNYLPAGYYAAGAAQPGNGQGMAHIGNGNSISLSNLGPARDGYARARSIGPSPPGSPAFNAHAASSSTLNLSQFPADHQRAPSAYLDDLFDSENGPPAPGLHVPGSQHRF
jgi:hypothetical protein